MLSVDQVLRIIAEKVTPLPSQRVKLSRAEGAILANPIVMDQDSPSFDRAQLDGYAVNSQSAIEGAELELVGQVDAGGAIFQGALATGQCTGINTGGTMPPGADAVLMVEHSERVTHSNRAFIRAKRAVPAGYGIQLRGSDVKAGEIVLHAGIKLRGTQLAICAAAGVGMPMVRVIRIAVLTTGDELLEVHDDPSPVPVGKIRNSNHPMLAAMAREETGHRHFLDLGTCPDDAPAVRAALQKGLQEADLLIVAGGMSMGTRDLVPPLLKELGVTFHVEKVKMKPGKPFVLGSWQGQKGTQWGQTFVAGLPGNPVSAFVTYQRFVREVIRQLSGETAARASLFRAETATPLPANGDREFYQPCVLRQSGSALVAEVLAWKGSANLYSLAHSDGLLIRAADAPELQAGAEVDVLSTGGR